MYFDNTNDPFVDIDDDYGRRIVNGTEPNQIVSFNSIQFNSIQFNSIQFNSIRFDSIRFDAVPKILRSAMDLSQPDELMP